MRADSMAAIPCLYNLFSFTPENLNNRMTYYDIDSFKEKYVPLPAPEPVTLPVSSSSDTESDDDASTSTSTSTSSKLSVSLPCNPSTGFDRDTLMKFIIAPSGAASDSLLWIAYIMIHGLERFETIENHYTESNTFKFDLVEMIRKHKPILKANKIKLTGLEESLVHKPFIHLETMQAIVLCKNISLCIVQERKYYEIQNGASSGSSTAIIEKIKGKYVLYTCPDKIKTEYLQYIRENYWLMESISAPIRPISAYKLQDLVDISTKLGLPLANIIPGKFGSIGTEKRKTKPELYEAICKCI